jgi:hypothetical protein
MGRRVLGRFELHLLLFFFALGCFLKPVLLPRPAASAVDVLLSYFLPWAGLIALLFLMGRAGPDEDEDQGPGGEPPSTR